MIFTFQKSINYFNLPNTFSKLLLCKAQKMLKNTFYVTNEFKLFNMHNSKVIYFDVCFQESGKLSKLSQFCIASSFLSFFCLAQFTIRSFSLT